MSAEVTALSSQLRQAQKAHDAHAVADLNYKIELMKLDIATLDTENKARMHVIRKIQFERAKAEENTAATLYLVGQVPAGAETDGRQWHIKKIEKGEIKLVGGGDVVGKIPSGLPSFRIPPLSLDAIMSLLSAAFIIALVAFMESISMAKALAAQDQAAPRSEPGTDRPGSGQYRRRLLPGLSGLRFLHRLGHQPAGRRQDRLRHGVQRPVRGGHAAVPDGLPLPPAQGHPGGDHPAGGDQPDHARRR